MTDHPIQAEYSLQEKELLLSQAYFEQKTVEELVELASQLAKNPVMLLDNAYQCLSYFPKIELGYPSWDMITAVGFMEKDLVIDMGRYFSQMTEKQRQGAYFFEYREANGQIFRKIISGIAYKDQVLGGIAIAEYFHPLQEEDLQFCDYLCKVMGSLLYKEVFFQKSFNQNFEQLFWDILSNKGLTSEVIEGRLGALGLVSVREPYYLIYVDILPAMKENVDYVRSKLKESMPDLFTVFYEDSLLIIGNISDEKYAPTVEKLKQFFELYYLYACISNPFRSLAELKQQYSLGRQGCSVGQKLYPDTHFFEFQHLNLYCLLQEAAENFSLQDYLHPGIRILKAYDQENTTDYCKTLIVYLENNLNILATANQLFIHRNTLSYRLRKISQLLNASLEDKNICLNLLLANLYDNLLTGSERETHQAA